MLALLSLSIAGAAPGLAERCDQNQLDACIELLELHAGRYQPLVDPTEGPAAADISMANLAYQVGLLLHPPAHRPRNCLVPACETLPAPARPVAPKPDAEPAPAMRTWTVEVPDALAGSWVWAVDRTATGRNLPSGNRDLVAQVAEPPVRVEREGVVTLQLPSDRLWRVYVAGPNGVGTVSPSRVSVQRAHFTVRRVSDAKEVTVVGPDAEDAAIVYLGQRLPLTPDGRMWVGAKTPEVTLVVQDRVAVLPISAPLDTARATDPVPRCWLATPIGPVGPDTGCDRFLSTVERVDDRYGRWEKTKDGWALVRPDLVDLPEPPMEGYTWRIDGVSSLGEFGLALEPGVHSAVAYDEDRPVRRAGQAAFAGTVTARPGERELEVDVRRETPDLRTVEVVDPLGHPVPFAAVLVRDPLTGVRELRITRATGTLDVPAADGAVEVGVRLYNPMPELVNRTTFRVPPGDTRPTAPWAGTDVVGRWRGQHGRAIQIESIVRQGGDYVLVDAKPGPEVTLGIVFALEGGGLYMPGPGELTRQ